MTLTMAASAGQVGRGRGKAREEKPFQSRSRKTTFEACPVRPPMTFLIRQSKEIAKEKFPSANDKQRNGATCVKRQSWLKPSKPKAKKWKNATLRANQNRTEPN